MNPLQTPASAELCERTVSSCVLTSSGSLWLLGQLVTHLEMLERVMSERLRGSKDHS